MINDSQVSMVAPPLFQQVKKAWVSTTHNCRKIHGETHVAIDVMVRLWHMGSDGRAMELLMFEVV